MKGKQSEALVFPEARTLGIARKEAKEATSSLPALARRLQGLVVTTSESYGYLMDEGRKVREIDRRIDDKQRSMTRLCDSLKKQIVELFRPMRKQCEDVLSLIEDKRQQYDGFLEEQRAKVAAEARKDAERELKRLEKRAEKLAAKADTRAEAKEILAEVPQLEELLPVIPEVEAPKIEGVSVARVWDYEIIDVQAVPETVRLGSGDLMPGEEFVALWERKFSREALMRAREGGIEVPGVRFYQKDSVRYERL